VCVLYMVAECFGGLTRFHSDGIESLIMLAQRGAVLMDMPVSGMR